jgi:hypothetical protein
LDHNPTLEYIAIYSAILPLFSGFIRFGKLEREMKILLLLISIGFIADFLSCVLFPDGKFIAGIVQIYIPIEAGLVLIILSAWQASQRISKLLKITIPLFIIFWFCAKMTFEPFKGTYFLTGSISSIILTLAAGYTLFIVIIERLQALHTNNRFWVLLSFVLYYTGILLPVTLQSLLVSYSFESLVIAWSITWVLATLSHIFYAIAFLCPQNQQ